MSVQAFNSYLDRCERRDAGVPERAGHSYRCGHSYGCGGYPVFVGGGSTNVYVGDSKSYEAHKWNGTLSGGIALFLVGLAGLGVLGHWYKDAQSDLSETEHMQNTICSLSIDSQARNEISNFVYNQKKVDSYEAGKYHDYLLSAGLLTSAGVAMITAYFVAAAALATFGTMLAIAGSAYGVYSLASYLSDSANGRTKEECVAQIRSIREKWPLLGRN